MSSSQVVEKQATDTTIDNPRLVHRLPFGSSLDPLWLCDEPKESRARGCNSRTHDYTQPRDRNQHLSDMITGFKKLTILSSCINLKKG